MSITWRVFDIETFHSQAQRSPIEGQPKRHPVQLLRGIPSLVLGVTFHQTDTGNVDASVLQHDSSQRQAHECFQALKATNNTSHTMANTLPCDQDTFFRIVGLHLGLE